ncbi:MAG TPA: LacI family DNA-binding transcriptional regulator [Anaerolineales bacterium]|nr:LacI family DNA-binding transcriptional regulator [Anaerolineales bacterium]
MASKTTLKQVAERAGVSYQTVSKVLNEQAQVSEETDKRIRDAVRDLGYRPNQIARNMRAKRSLMIGYSWIQIMPDQVNHILDHFLTSMVQEAEAAGYHLLPFPYREGEALVSTYRDLIDTGRVDGFVLSSVNYSDPRISFLLEREFPFVAFGRSNPDLDFPFVDVDGNNGLCQATEYLISRGHRRIAAIAWPESSRVGNERLQGYLEAMQTAGLEIYRDCIQRGEGTFEFGREAASRLIELPAPERPSAIVTLNDTQAIGALHAAREHGLDVGHDIAIVGFDDAPMSQYVIPALTTIRQPIHEAGRKCVEILVSLMKGEEPAESHVLLLPTLITRASA